MNSFLGLSESDSDDEDPNDVKPVCKKPRLAGYLEETKVLVDISPQKAIEEEITYQKIQAHHATESDLQNNRSVLLRFLDGSEDFMKRRGTAMISAAGEFIAHQVKQHFMFSSEEQTWLEDNAEYVVRILQRIQCRQYVLDKSLSVPKVTVDGYFVRARTEINEARRKAMEREAAIMHAKRARKHLMDQFESSSRRMAETTREMFGTNEDITDTDDYNALEHMVTDSMNTMLISKHEFSDNPEFNAICGEVVKKLLSLQLSESRIRPQPEYEIQSSPPRTPTRSPEGSRSPSPVRTARAFFASAGRSYAGPIDDISNIFAPHRLNRYTSTSDFPSSAGSVGDISNMFAPSRLDRHMSSTDVPSSAGPIGDLSNMYAASRLNRHISTADASTARAGLAFANTGNSSAGPIGDLSNMSAPSHVNRHISTTDVPSTSRVQASGDLFDSVKMEYEIKIDPELGISNSPPEILMTSPEGSLSPSPARIARSEQAFVEAGNRTAAQPIQISSIAHPEADIGSIAATSSPLNRYIDTDDAPSTSAVPAPGASLYSDSRNNQILADSAPLADDELMELDYENIPQEGLRSALHHSSSHTVPPKRVRFRDVHPSTIQLYWRVCEDREPDEFWPPEHAYRKPMFLDTGSTFWFEPLDYKNGARYMIERGDMRLQAGTRAFAKRTIGPEEYAKDMLPVTFLLHCDYPWPLVPDAVLNQRLPAFPGTQPRFIYIQPKIRESLNSYFANDVFKRLCYFRSSAMGAGSIREYQNKFGHRDGMEMMLNGLRPEYNKLLLTDSILGMCNPDILLNTCLLVCHPRVEPGFFVDRIFEFVRTMVSQDLSIQREKDFAKEKDQMLRTGQQDFLPQIYFEQDLYEKSPDFDVTGGVFLSFGHDIMFNYADLEKNIKNMNASGDPKMKKVVKRMKRRRNPKDVCFAAIAECISLTLKVIYELQKLWTLKNWWSTRQFPDIWLITIPEGIHHDVIKVYNDLLRKTVSSTGVFPVPVKLMDWDALLRKRASEGFHDGESNLPEDVEERLMYLFGLMRHKADVRYRRSQEERKYAVRNVIVPGETEVGNMFDKL